MSKLIIITGASSGLGKEIALMHAKEGDYLMLISRNEKKLLRMKESQCMKNNIYPVTRDLSKKQNFNWFNKKIMSLIKLKKLNEITLYNNASSINPIQKIYALEFNEIYQNINLNLSAPFSLSSILLKIKNETGIKATIINISTGVSKNPIEGWSIYCSTKAGINMLTSCINNENADVYTLAINPGPMDTSMQKAIRNSDRSVSPISDKFRNMKKEKLLQSPKVVAKKIIDIVALRKFGSGDFVDFNKL